MAKAKIDLHMHSTYSDGKLSPEQLIDLAIKREIPAIAITDHDAIEGISVADDYAEKKSVEFVRGVEFSANPENLAKEIHIVGLFIDYKNKGLGDILIKQKELRIIVIKKMIKKLNDLGYQLTFKEVADQSGKSCFGRPEIARLLMKKYPEFKTRKQVFNELLGKDGKAFFTAESSSIESIIRAVHSAGGIAILAHPAYLFENALKVIEKFKEYGGDGIEVDCPYLSFGEDAKKLRTKFEKIAKEKNLVISGGTDFHGLDDHGTEIGDFGITIEEFKKLKEYQQRKIKT